MFDWMIHLAAALYESWDDDDAPEKGTAPRWMKITVVLLWIVGSIAFSIWLY